MVEAAKNHQRIATNIRELVVNPFGRWCDAHASRVQNSQDDLTSKIKAHDRQADAVRKLRTSYFNKCRLVEDQEEENKLAFQDPEKQEKGKERDISSPKVSFASPPAIVVQPEEEMLPVEIGDRTYTPDALKTLLADMLAKIPIGEHKVAIMGIYQNVSSGSDITQYIMQNMGAANNVTYAENIGQDLVDRGLLRLIGNVGSTFANSSRMKYQWRPKVFQITGVPEKKSGLVRAGTIGSLADSIPESPVNAITSTVAAYNPFNNPYPNETPAARLKREAKQADDNYRASVRKLDLLRCNLEESIMDHLRFLERCETDRLRAIRSVILDFSGAISNAIPSFQSQVDHMMLYQETINPLGDLRYLLENYRTGPFIPRVTAYENYYGSVDDQVFGVDLEARARADKKRVPLIVTSILTFLDKHYPDLDGDATRRSIWTIDVPLAATHHLRNEINVAGNVKMELFERYDIPIVASVLKLYLLELPDSLISSVMYDIIKTIYETTQDATPNSMSPDTSIDSSPRIKVLQSTLGQLKLNNIATLDAITTHFTRLIDLTSADEAFIAELATILAPCILRPRLVSTLTIEDRHPYRLMRDLFDHKDAIFGELKRQASSASRVRAIATPSLGDSLQFSSQTSARARAVSGTDEGGRRAAMEARAKAINETHQRSRSPAPAPSPPPKHRRDRSTDGSNGGTGRFPVRPDRNSLSSGAKRASLEVPGSETSSPVSQRQAAAATNITPIITTTLSTNSGHTQGAEQHGIVNTSTTSNLASVTNGDHNNDAKPTHTASPVSPIHYGALPDGAMPGAFDSTSSIYASSDLSDPVPSQTSEQNGGSSALKRTSALGSGKNSSSTRYGSLKNRASDPTDSDTSGTNKAERDGNSNGVGNGVQLRDAAMDDDFS